jgi:DNA-directed RNA polymerase subunit RPC12/RpoP
MDVSVEIHCGKCGSANYSLPEEMTSQASIICNDCGSGLATLDQLREELMAQVMARSAEALRHDLSRAGEQGRERP